MGVPRQGCLQTDRQWKQWYMSARHIFTTALISLVSKYQLQCSINKIFTWNQWSNNLCGISDKTDFAQCEVFFTRTLTIVTLRITYHYDDISPSYNLTSWLVNNQGKQVRNTVYQYVHLTCSKPEGVKRSVPAGFHF